MMQDEAERLLAEIEAKRGYVHEYHRVLASTDPAFLRAYEDFLAAAYTNARSLGRRDKELIFIGVLTGLGASQEHIAAHLRAAHKVGVDARESLEALELCLPPAGVPKFMNAFEAWKQTFGADARGLGSGDVGGGAEG